MKQKFDFDSETGTYIPKTIFQGSITADEKNDIHANSTSVLEKPTFQNDHPVSVKPENMPHGPQVLKMKRTSKPTDIQLINEKGIPEAYLDSETTEVVMFREREDYDICQISDEKTGKVLAYIGGFALQINFNMEELNTMERVEQCLQGIQKLFRHHIMNQNFSTKK